MTLLAIDTSSAYASIALFDGEAILAEETWHAHRRHDDELFPRLERMLSLAGLARADVTRVAVAVGPGSFTGVRVGIAAAQGMARASGAATVGVATLDAIAHPWRAARSRVCALVPAGRGEHYAAVYRERRGTWSRRSPIIVGTLADLARAIATDALFAGEIDPATAAEVRLLFGRRAVVPPASALVRRAGHVAELGWARAEAGETIDPGALVPLYVRGPAIRGRAGEIVDDLAPAVAPALRRGE